MKNSILSIICFLALTANLGAQVLLKPFSVEVNGKKLWGYKDTLGNVVTEPKYTQCSYFYSFEKFQQVRISEKIGIVNSKGKEITPIKYDGMYEDPKDGLMRVEIGYKYGFIDTTGKEIIPLIYDEVEDFDSGLGWVKLGQKMFFVDTKGKAIIDISTFEETQKQFGNGLCGVQQNGRWGYMDVNGKVVIPCQYDNVMRMTESVGVVLNGGKKEEIGYYTGSKYGFIDKSGKALTPLKYNCAEPMSEGIAVVNIGGKVNVYGSAEGGKWGYVDSTGKEITLMKYDYATNCSEGLAAVNLGGKWQDAGDGSMNIEDGKWGYINTKGKEIIPLQFEAASSFILGEANVTKASESFSINKAGKRISE